MRKRMREHYMCLGELIRNLHELERVTHKKTDVSIYAELENISPSSVPLPSLELFNYLKGKIERGLRFRSENHEGQHEMSSGGMLLARPSSGPIDLNSDLELSSTIKEM